MLRTEISALGLWRSRYITGERLATDVLAIGARSAVASSHPTASLPPNRCAAHREPFSSVEVHARGKHWDMMR